ncbi:MAG: CvpA family protein [Pseudomonadaceae bacterium]|nr:CvpA family protein [Pseudomonadaceae bacterium]
MEQLIQNLNLFDGIFLAVTLFLAVIACRRGVVNELIHTLIFLAAATAGFIFMNQSTIAADPFNTVFLTTNLGYFLLAAYLFSSFLLGTLGYLMMKDQAPPGLRGRLSAGGLALVKILGAALMLHVWYIAHMPLPHPDRLDPLPALLKNSELVQRSDAPNGFANRLALFFQRQGLLILPIEATTANTPEEQTSSSETR